MPWSVEIIDENKYLFTNQNQNTPIKNFTLRRASSIDHILHIQCDEKGKEKIEKTFAEISAMDNELLILTDSYSPYANQGLLSRKWQIECALIAANELSSFSLEDRKIFTTFGLDHLSFEKPLSMMMIKVERNGGSFELELTRQEASETAEPTFQVTQKFTYKPAQHLCLFGKKQKINLTKNSYDLSELRNYILLLTERVDNLEKIGEDYFVVHNRVCKEVHQSSMILSFQRLKSKLDSIRKNITALQELFAMESADDVTTAIRKNSKYVNVSTFLKAGAYCLHKDYTQYAMDEHKKENFVEFFTELDLLANDSLALEGIVSAIHDKKIILEHSITYNMEL
ncbi:hypothetical protein Lbru_1286 [Legionella brunensis]|uniref:Uncharacterized protein n=2 Tax=Legionella brunensis TaxID=29422 RepID=A0A0W0SNW8_9GAMM|nr:hypothetical protein Lbru_1286 [Legionella brunensis]